MKLVITCAAAFLVSALSSAAAGAREEADTANVSCQRAFELIKAHDGDTNFVIIDFRPKEMYEKGHLQDAIYFDFFSDEVDAWLDALDRNKTYLIYCNVGKRTGLALKKMHKMGFARIYHMYEGIPVWRAKGYKTLPDTE